LSKSISAAIAAIAVPANSAAPWMFVAIVRAAKPMPIPELDSRPNLP
jgi:hypothetical protein